jgi:molybdopterin adenylyltransferase
VRVLIPDDQPVIERELRRLCDDERCELVLTTGGTGPAPRDVTPEATRAVLERELPGFGEIMRVHSFAKVPTAILSRSIAGTRGRNAHRESSRKPEGDRRMPSVAGTRDPRGSATFARRALMRAARWFASC